MLIFSFKNFSELSLLELHNIYALRSEVFVVEQKCVYQDIDGKDKKALHVIGKSENEIIAYARILDIGISYPNYISIGRLVVKKKMRGIALGHKLINFCLQTIEKQYPKQAIKLSAQSHLEKFYNEHDFKKHGVGYLEDGISHIAMIKAAR